MNILACMSCFADKSQQSVFKFRHFVCGHKLIDCIAPYHLLPSAYKLHTVSLFLQRGVNG